MMCFLRSVVTEWRMHSFFATLAGYLFPRETVKLPCRIRPGWLLTGVHFCSEYRLDERIVV